jgi:hypothetical protein
MHTTEENKYDYNIYLDNYINKYLNLCNGNNCSYDVHHCTQFIDVDNSFDSESESDSDNYDHHNNDIVYRCSSDEESDSDSDNDSHCDNYIENNKLIENNNISKSSNSNNIYMYFGALMALGFTMYKFIRK